MAINWINLFKKYKGKWLALQDDEKTVIGVGNTAKEAYEKAVKRGSQNPILTKIPSSLVSYVG